MREEDFSNITGGWTDTAPKNHTCDFCGVTGPEVINYRQRTQYADEKHNWVNACPKCKEINDDHWDAMWDELMSNV